MKRKLYNAKKIIVPLLLLICVIAVNFAPIVISTAQAQVQTTAAPSPKTAPTEAKQQEKYDVFSSMNCGVFGSSNVSDCIVELFYFIPYSFGAWILEQSAHILDWSSAMTLSSNLFTQTNIVQTGWKVTRDVSNIFFILILLYISLSLVLGLNGHTNKKMIMSVVVVAVMINFSLFFVQVVIDATNTLALVFYNQIKVTTNGQVLPAEDYTKPGVIKTDVTVKEISVSLAQAFQPQVFQTKNFWDGLKQSGGSSAGKEIAIFILMGVIFIAAAWSFFMAAVAFIGRIASLWLAIIFAPIALISSIIPSLNKRLGAIGWSEWSSNLISAAISAPIFFFFIYLISLLSQATFASKSILAGTDTTAILIGICIQTMIFVILLKKATEYVKKGSGEIGTAISGVVTKGANFVGGMALGVGKVAAGAAVGTAIGASARLGQKTIGKAGSALANSSRLGDAAATSWFARQALNLSKGAAKASFDGRNTKLANTFTKKTGISLNKYSAISSKDTAGGYDEKDRREALKLLKIKEKLGYNKKEEANINTKIGDIDKKIEAAGGVKKIEEKKIIYQQNKAEEEKAEKEVASASAAVAQAEKAYNEAYSPTEKARTKTVLENLKNAEAASKKVLDTAKNQSALAKNDFDSINVLAKTKENLLTAAKANKEERFRAFLHAEGRKSGFKALDNGTVDTTKTKANVRSIAHSVRRASGLAVSGAVAGSVIPGIGTATGFAGGLLVGVAREVFNKGASREKANSVNTAEMYSGKVMVDGKETDGTKALEGQLKGKTTYKDVKEQKEADVAHALHVIEGLAGKKHDDHGHGDEKHAEDHASHDDHGGHDDHGAHH